MLDPGVEVKSGFKAVPRTLLPGALYQALLVAVCIGYAPLLQRLKIFHYYKAHIKFCCINFCIFCSDLISLVCDPGLTKAVWV